MQAIILSAGRGSRLLPLTTDLPKCLLPIGLTTVLGMQLDTLLKHGVDNVTVVTGFNEHLVQAEIDARQVLLKPFLIRFFKLPIIWQVVGWLEIIWMMIFY